MNALIILLFELPVGKIRGNVGLFFTNIFVAERRFYLLSRLNLISNYFYLFLEIFCIKNTKENVSLFRILQLFTQDCASSCVPAL